jgi:hypothetical protein
MEQEVKDAKEGLKNRQNDAVTKKRGKGIILLKKISIPEGQKEIVIEGYGAVVGSLYEVVASENQACRTPKHVKDWMLENKYIGTVYPIRVGKPITRVEQTEVKFV